MKTIYRDPATQNIIHWFRVIGEGQQYLKPKAHLISKNFFSDTPMGPSLFQLTLCGKTELATEQPIAVPEGCPQTLCKNCLKKADKEERQ